MTLSAPTIVGGLSPFSTSVRVQGQIPGAEVQIQSNGTPIARQVATSFDEVIKFDPGVSLNAGDKVTASQSLGGDASAPTPLPTEVLRPTPPFSGHRFISHIYRCGVSLFMGGIVPGAEVHLSTSGGIALGNARSVDGGAVVDLSAAIGHNAIIESHQVVGGAPGPSVNSPPADDPPPLINLFVETPMACAPGIMVHGVIDGAEILVRTDAGNPASERDFKVPVRNQYLTLPPLSAGQKISVQEVMRRCELEGGVQQYDVLPMSFASKPVIVGPLCAGTIRIFVRNVFPGASIVAKQGATVVGQSVAYANDVELWTAPLTAGQDLIVSVSLCGASAESYGEPVDPQPATIEPCKIVEPLMDCAMQIWVRNAHAGGLLAAFSDQRGQISQWVRAPGAEALVNLVLALTKGETVHMVQVACGGAPTPSSNSPTVQAWAGLPPPKLEHPVFWDRPFVRAVGVVPGAVVQLYAREGGFISQAIADYKGQAALPRVGLAQSLIPGWHVYARQILCDQISAFSEPPEEVIDRTPFPPKIDAPANHGSGVARRPHLAWSDPGAGTIHEATQFLVQLSTPDHPLYDAWVVNEVVSGHSYDVPQDLAYGGKYIWQVTAALGDPGFEVRSKASPADFTVEQAPAAPPPQPPQQPGFSAALVYNCNTDHRSVDVYKRDVTAGEALQFVKTIGAAYDEFGTCPASGTEPVKIDLPDGHWTQIVLVDADLIGCMDQNGDVDPDRQSCQRFMQVVLGKTNGPVFQIIAP